MVSYKYQKGQRSLWPLFAGVLFALALIPAGSAPAQARWNSDASLSAGVELNDNIDLLPEGDVIDEEEVDVVLRFCVVDGERTGHRCHADEGDGREPSRESPRCNPGCNGDL